MPSRWTGDKQQEVDGMGLWVRALVGNRSLMCGNMFESLQEGEPPSALYFRGGVGLYSLYISLVLVPIII